MNNINDCPDGKDYIYYKEKKILDYGGSDINYDNSLINAGLEKIDTYFIVEDVYSDVISNTNNDCPDRCFQYCNFLVNDVTMDYTVNLKKKCAGFQYGHNESHYQCTFKVGTIQYPPDWFYIQGSFNSYFPESNFVLDGSFFRVPPVDRSNIPPPPPVGPQSPPPRLENVILQPQILIPLISGSVIVLILFIFIFRLCTRERADALDLVFRTILGRKSNRIVIDTGKKVTNSQSIRR